MWTGGRNFVFISSFLKTRLMFEWFEIIFPAKEHMNIPQCSRCGLKMLNKTQEQAQDRKLNPSDPIIHCEYSPPRNIFNMNIPNAQDVGEKCWTRLRNRPRNGKTRLMSERKMLDIWCQSLSGWEHGQWRSTSIQVIHPSIGDETFGAKDAHLYNFFLYFKKIWARLRIRPLCVRVVLISPV